MSGAVLLNDPDGAATSITYSGAASLEDFCLACHDANGAAGDAEPFDDGGMPANIAAGWPTSAHKTGGQTCAGDGADGCHGSAHGSEKRYLLGPAEVPATRPGLVEEEEGFCYQCHPGVETEFGRSSRHDVAHADQNANGSKIECTNCHNPHVSTLAQPLIDPDMTDVVFSGNETDFCLACHDGAAPAGLSFPSKSPGSGYNKSRWTGSKHQLSGQAVCTNCHERHASSQGSLKRLRYDQTDHVTYSHGSEQYALCWQCHDEDKVVRTAEGSSADNAFGTRHSLHVRSESASCIECHDVHFSYDGGEDGLMGYAYPVKEEWTFSLTTSGTTYTLSSAFRDTGTNKGSCYLSCHGQGHNPETYTGVDADTLK
jgi:predicted CXXCH cytochrome family protein